MIGMKVDDKMTDIMVSVQRCQCSSVGVKGQQSDVPTGDGGGG